MNHLVQEWIHRLEVGRGARLIKVGAVGLGLLFLAVAYDLLAFRNLARPEAMDAAQVARNVARGNGFATEFIRPLSIHLLESRALKLGVKGNDPAHLEGKHPDLANPPAYPLLLAGYMRLLGLEKRTPRLAIKRADTADFLIALLNQTLLVVLVAMVYGLGRTLFDHTVGWFAAVSVAVCELMWRFSMSGLPTLLLMVLVVGLFWCLAGMDAAARAGQRGRLWFAGMAALVGFLCAGVGLTAYAALGVIVPVLGFLLSGPLRRRSVTALITAAVFLGMVLPWLARNHQLSGCWFGTAGYAMLSNTAAFPADSLERSLAPAFDISLFRTCGRKLISGFAEGWQQLPQLGGSWVTAFFLVGLLVRFTDPVRARVRWLLVGFLVLLMTVQAVARTHLSTGSGELTSENLLVVLGPIAMVFGAAMFCLLLDQVTWEVEGIRILLVGLFLVLCAFPLALSLLSGLARRPDPVVHPPYFPPFARELGGWMGANELTMSDIPWAVAWYGDRKSIWLTRYLHSANREEDLYAINDFRRKISAVYLSPLIGEERFFSQLAQGRVRRLFAKTQQQQQEVERTEVWGELVLGAYLSGDVPAGFPLKQVFGPYAKDGHLMFLDRKRWNEVGKKR